MDAIDDLFDDIERRRKSKEYSRDADQLESYLHEVQRIMEFLEEGIYLFQNSHQQYASDWSGRSKSSYEDIYNDITQSTFHLYDVKDELFQTLRLEISRLRELASA
ncbi:hypothetical protein [Priestia megaterium]|uniref:hypothetical protein n=1 Tax=Priestia megaterium TaxID=1404 RepID=UPI00372D333B